MAATGQRDALCQIERFRILSVDLLGTRQNVDAVRYRAFGGSYRCGVFSEREVGRVYERLFTKRSGDRPCRTLSAHRPAIPDRTDVVVRRATSRRVVGGRD